MAEPSAVSDALQQATDAFEYVGQGSPAFETGIDQDDEWKTQLTKACRYLESARVLRTTDGFHGSVVELSFGAIERSIEGYCCWNTDDTVERFHDHEAAYDFAADQGLFERRTASALKGLYSDNRSGHYYGVQVPTRQKAAAMYALSERIHHYVAQQIRAGGVCTCT